MSDKKLFPMRFAHRGLVQYAPENTVGAFQAAVDCGCEGIELDLRLSKDGVPMVVHDTSLRRLSDGKAPFEIRDMTAAEIMAVDIPYAGHLLPHNPPVPYSESVGSVAVYTEEELAEQRAADKRITHIFTFADFDKWFSGISADIIVEVEFCAPGLMAPVYEVLRNSPNCARYILFSGNDDCNEEIQSFLREHGKPDGLRLGANIRRLTDKNREFVLSADLYEVGLNDKWFTKEDVDFLAGRGIKVFSNLGDYPEWWVSLAPLGVEAFKTNYAEAYTEWLEGENA